MRAAIAPLAAGVGSTKRRMTIAPLAAGVGIIAAAAATACRQGVVGAASVHHLCSAPCRWRQRPTAAEMLLPHCRCVQAGRGGRRLGAPPVQVHRDGQHAGAPVQCVAAAACCTDARRCCSRMPLSPCRRPGAPASSCRQPPAGLGTSPLTPVLPAPAPFAPLPAVTDCSDPNNPKYVLVIVQVRAAQRRSRASRAGLAGGLLQRRRAVAQEQSSVGTPRAYGPLPPHAILGCLAEHRAPGRREARDLQSDPTRPHTAPDPCDFYAMQYTARLNAEKLKNFMHRLSGRFGKKNFNMRLAPNDVSGGRAHGAGRGGVHGVAGVHGACTARVCAGGRGGWPAPPACIVRWRLPAAPAPTANHPVVPSQTS